MSEATLNAFSQVIYWHIGLCILLPTFPFFNLIVLFKSSSHTKRLKALALAAPAYYSTLSGVILTGLVAWAMLGFGMSLRVLLMVVLCIVVFVYEIKRHKRQKLIKVEADVNVREAFFSFCKKKYCFDLVAFLFIFAYCYGV